jgi:hypothetical protein
MPDAALRNRQHDATLSGALWWGAGGGRRKCKTEFGRSSLEFSFGSRAGILSVGAGCRLVDEPSKI